VTATKWLCGNKSTIAGDGFPEVMNAKTDMPMIKLIILLHGEG
jgi:hypothetical protein